MGLGGGETRRPPSGATDFVALASPHSLGRYAAVKGLLHRPLH